MIVLELKPHFKLRHLLRAIKLARSVFYYQCQALKVPDRYENEKALIHQIFSEHKGRYGYRRIMYALRRYDVWLNHKTVQRLMLELALKSHVRPKRYNSYRGEEGRIAPNILKRDFASEKPDEKWVTDVTEFKVQDKKVYLSPLIDLFNQEVVSYQISTSQALPLVTKMLEKALKSRKVSGGLILHSDQGWQYQHRSVRQWLETHKIEQSMSRRGNCLDNAVAENFFGILKSEMYHGQSFSSVDALIKSLHEYIAYYNNERIKVKLKGLTPVEYRSQALLAA